MSTQMTLNEVEMGIVISKKQNKYTTNSYTTISTCITSA